MKILFSAQHRCFLDYEFRFIRKNNEVNPDPDEDKYTETKTETAGDELDKEVSQIVQEIIAQAVALTPKTNYVSMEPGVSEISEKEAGYRSLKALLEELKKSMETEAQIPEDLRAIVLKFIGEAELKAGKSPFLRSMSSLRIRALREIGYHRDALSRTHSGNHLAETGRMISGMPEVLHKNEIVSSMIRSIEERIKTISEEYLSVIKILAGIPEGMDLVKQEDRDTIKQLSAPQIQALFFIIQAFMYK